jgi:hypothetical protein
MKNIFAALLKVLAFVLCFGASCCILADKPGKIFTQKAPQGIKWQVLDTGLSLGEYVSPIKSDIGNSTLTILKIDPAHYSFHLAAASEKTGLNHMASEWCSDKKFIAAINAGMYHQGGQNVGFMKNFKYINNAAFSKTYKCILAFNRKDSSVPEIQIIDMDCQPNWKEIVEHYNTCTQSIRMIDCHQKNVWSPKPRKWSTVVWGMDKKGNALMIYCRSPYTAYDFINIVLQSPLDIAQMMYLEGGPEASFYLKSGKVSRDLIGSYETGFNENDDYTQAWPIPNVIGIRKK